MNFFKSKQLDFACRYLVPLLIVLLTLRLHLFLGPMVGGRLFLLFYPAVFFGALLGGFWAGILSTSLAAILVWRFLLPHSDSLLFHHGNDAFALIVFTTLGLAFSVFSEKFHSVLRLHVESEVRFRSLLESVPDALVVASKNGRIEIVNKQTELLFGYDRSELIGKPVEGLLPERFRTVHASHCSNYAAQPVHHEMGRGDDHFGLKKDGSEFPVDISLNPFYMGKNLNVIAAVRDISERHSLQEQRAAAIGTREEVMALVSHDLKTPLAAILLSGQMLSIQFEKGEVNEGSLRRFIEIVNRSARSMDRLIADILAFSKIQSGTFSIDPKAENFGAILETTTQIMEPLALNGALKLNLNVEPGLPLVTCDSVRIIQVLSNLLGNSIKFTPKGGLISVEVKRVGEELRVRVADSGSGISSEDMPHLFERFWQAKDKTRIGTGLGLAIAKEIVSAHHGRIWVDPEARQGAVFYFTLPFDQPKKTI